MLRTPLQCLTAIATLGFLPAFAQSPTPAADPTAIVARIRTAALDYTAKLQDFVCTRIVKRSADGSGKGEHWKLLETQEGELSYVSHKESYQPLKVNGQTTNLDKRVKKGYFQPGGEFGQSLREIFDPQAAAELTWDHDESSGAQRSCVFRYNVPLATTTWVMTVNLQHIKLGHHGWVQADCETGAVTGFHMETDTPIIREQGHNIKIGAVLDVRYGPVTIDSRPFLLPLSATEVAVFDKSLTKAEIQFQQYRKYDSSSKLTFDPGK